jgi:hypothetical protein
MGPRLIDVTKETTKEYSRLYEWRLNLKTRKVTGKYLTGTEVALEFPVINNKYVGLCHKYAYAQVADSPASFAGGPGIGIAKHTMLHSLVHATSIKTTEIGYKVTVVIHTLAACPSCLYRYLYKSHKKFRESCEPNRYGKIRSFIA